MYKEELLRTMDEERLLGKKEQFKEVLLTGGGRIEVIEYNQSWNNWEMQIKSK